MLTINLLPAEEKKLLVIEEWRRIAQFFGIGIAGVLLAGIAIFLPSYVRLFLHAQDLERALRFEEEASKELKVQETIVRARDVRTVFDSVRIFLNDGARGSPTLEFFFRDTPGITVLSIGVHKDGVIALTGFAGSRRNLLDFEKMLRDSGRFQELSFPLSNIVRESNIHFSIQGKLKSSYGL